MQYEASHAFKFPDWPWFCDFASCVASLNNKFDFVSENVLKLSSSDAEFENFSGGKAPKSTF